MKLFKDQLVLLFVVGFLSTNPAFSQPCSGGFSAGYPCNKVTLVSKVNLVDLNGPSGNDIWGFSSPSGREFALMGLTNGTAFVDITNPSAPVVIGNLPTHTSNSTWRDIRVKNGYAYIGADSAPNHGIQIFDLSLLDAAINDPASVFPITFSETSQVSFGVSGSSHNLVTNLNPASNYLYVVGQQGNQFEGVTPFDLTDPELPVPQSSYNADGYSHDMICVNYRGPDADYIGQEICIGFNENIFSIIDMTDKGNIVGISAPSYNGVRYTHQGWISDDHKYLMLDDELDETNFNHNVRTYFFDISDLNNPVPLTNNYYEHSTSAIDHNMFVKGPYLYQANYESGLRVLNIGNLDNGISSISEAAYFDILPSRTTPSFEGAWGVYPYLSSGNILVSGRRDVDAGVQTGGLFVLSPNLPHHYLTTNSASEIQTICAGTSVNFTFNKVNMYGFSGTVNYTVEDLDPALTSTVTNTSGNVIVNISNTGALSDNTYFSLKATPTNGTPSSKISGAVIVRPLPTAAPLLTPSDNSQTNDETPSLIWTPESDTDSYNISIATDPDITNIVQSQTGLTTNQYDATPLANNTEYFWQVTSVNSCGQTTSSVFRFDLVTGVVPVELVDFTGVHQNEVNHLHWTTAAEINNAGFEIQRKQANRERTFGTIGWVEAQSATGATYKFEDEQLSIGAQYYYRLKQLDLDGNFEYSPIISIKVSGTLPGLVIYPNPVQDQLSADLFLPNLESGETVDFSILNMTGQTIRSWTFNPETAFSIQHIPIEDLAPGVYIGMITKDKLKLPVRFVKW